ncbi:MAG: ABC transporter ATP-binding protein [Rhodospirillaceae bacterium]|jgi:NitT/TauT family transport system ATP-binding protein|nr:ABC transporter ATP-binding protein [Rhodospirillaceae bacterium]MBT4116226.1 ABC transporter ATP-binding protein [Rhodospirillaceae bacterium]MBT4673129.1 ABC transporter ATP-binding protein [Rhodospirillaceae bacterium]MBT5177555.1 ABC transporter ATP-binding protein [Rhodospirillaceae bacterium]MBT5838816.1 ABC transporter ATP-binding protein [Rhodospirillaceae bacterium]
MQQTSAITQNANVGGDIAIHAGNVTHIFGTDNDAQQVTALDDVSIDVSKGELLCLIGPSGCGKSTLLNIMGGLIEPTRGDVQLGAAKVSGPMPHDVAFVFQESALFPWSTVVDNVIVALEFQGVPKEERSARAWSALESVDLADFGNHYPGQISGGMKQRAQLARALSLETEILLMDEPFGALDEQTRMILGEDLSVMLSKTDKTIVFVTHSLAEAVFLADRVAVMSARPGKFKEVIEVGEGHPRDPDFMLSEKFGKMRNDLYGMLHDEIRKAVDGESAQP